MPKNANDRKIIIMDKKATRRDTLASRLRLQGHEVELSLSGFQTLSLLENELYDSLILIEDTQDMPVLEVISLARNLFDKNELQIIYLDKKPKEDDILEYNKLGLNAFLVWHDKVFASLLEKVQSFKPAKDRSPNSLLKEFK